MRTQGLVSVALLTVLALGALEATAPARAADDFQYLIRMDHQSFIPAARDYEAGLAYLAEQGYREVAHLLVQMAEVPSASERSALAARGLTLQGYVPGRAYYATVATRLTSEDLVSLGARWVGPLSYEEKVAASVRRSEFGSWTEYAGGLRILAVQFHADVSAAVAAEVLAGVRGERGDWIESIQTQILAMDPADVEQLAARDEVKYIMQNSPPLSEVNDGIRAAIEVNPVHNPPYGLTGVGSNILVYDAGLVDLLHLDFSPPGRVTWGEPGAVAAHPTHVGGTVGGNGTQSSGTFKGMAPDTRITSYAYEACVPSCLYNSPQDIEANYNQGAMVHGAMLATNSLGSNVAGNGYPCSWEGDYELTAQLLDRISHDGFGLSSGGFLSIWAAGNERGNGRCGTTYNTIGVPATAKDNIVVGATNSNNHSMTFFSSWGPVDDGRIRPDVSAPGCQQGGDGGITSTAVGAGYNVFCGTSMATPATAGVVALLRQQWSLTPGLPAAPLPSMVKALLINTAFDYGNVGPDYQFGYGEIRAVALVDHLRNGYLIRTGTIETAAEVVIPIEVPIGQSVLRATVAWDDPPGEILALIELVNDLDLSLESPTGQFTSPWILAPLAPASPATRGADHLNPVEQVLVDNPAAGTWKVHLRGFQVPVGPQSFSVVANAPEGVLVAVQSESGEAGPALSDLSSSPNPFSPRTTIRFRTDGRAPLSLQVFDASGRVVRTLLAEERRAAGIHFVTWDGRDDGDRELPGGVYFYQVRGGGESAGEKVLLLR